MTFDPRPPEIEPTPNAEPTYWHDTTDDEIETKLDRIWGRNSNHNLSDPTKMGGGSMLPSNIYIVATAKPFAQGLGHAMNTYRGFGGLVPKESVWRQLATMFQEKNENSDKK